MNNNNQNGKKMPTQDGRHFVNLFGFCFFVNADFTYSPWKVTLSTAEEAKKDPNKKVMLPPTNEWGRLKALGNKTVRLTDDEQKKALHIAENLKRNPMWSLYKNAEAKTQRRIHLFRALRRPICS